MFSYPAFLFTGPGLSFHIYARTELVDLFGRLNRNRDKTSDSAQHIKSTVTLSIALEKQPTSKCCLETESWIPAGLGWPVCRRHVSWLRRTMSKDSPELSLGAEALCELDTSQGKAETRQCQDVLILWSKESRAWSLRGTRWPKKWFSEIGEEDRRGGVDRD